jgi:DNA modification methylase
VLVATRPGDLLLDPFGGAGTLALAARRHDRRFRRRRIRLWRRLLIESVSRYVEMARRRLAADNR